MGQVTHALLTRPPLSYDSLGFIITPFDLHVLSTPPAFILSQDQTLMLKCYLRSSSKLLSSYFRKLFNNDPLSRQFLLAYPFFTVRFALFSELSFAIFDCYGIFRVALLFICQGTYLLSISAAT